MTSRLRLLALILVVASAAVGVAGCAGKSINHVLADPSRYRNREIKVSGDVVNAYSIAGRGVYQIEDRTGRLWVASDRGVPHRGARVSVTGTIREGFNLGPLADFARLPDGALIMIEREHRARD
ncbi:MAG TPA: hypothetical protein VFV98_18850 [Vicinamibacterales bacterium]|nr:hypothetical protein [Vicinamibacterales bacterium]